MIAPLITRTVQDALRKALRDGTSSVETSLDLERTRTHVELAAHGWSWRGVAYPWLEDCRERTIYRWTGAAFAGWLRCSFSAARVRWPASATATKLRN